MQGSYNNFAYFSADFSASREKLETMITELISPEFFEREHGDVESFIQQEGTDLLRTLLQGYLNIRAAKEALATKKPQYIIRADIKCYYKSIRHALLIQDIKRYYSDLNVQNMLENIIKNPIETPRGYKSPDYGIALRGPLSRWCDWWVQTTECWTRHQLLGDFLDACWDKSAYAIAAALTPPQKFAVKETPQVTWSRKLPT